jgi:hypothetical protein
MDSCRIGLPTSGEISKLMSLAKDGKSFGAPALTYIKNKQRERKLKVELNLDTNDRAITWGRALEGYVFENYVDTSYSLASKDTIVHPSGFWCGTPDLKSIDCVGDIKCPYTRGSFCDLVEIMESGDLDLFKKDEPGYYWQLVSNSILLDVGNAELIVWYPYITERDAIVEHISNIDDFQLQMDAQWTVHAGPERMPHMPVDSEYKNINRFRFQVPTEDKERLYETVRRAYQHLVLV